MSIRPVALPRPQTTTGATSGQGRGPNAPVSAEFAVDDDLVQRSLQGRELLIGQTLDEMLRDPPQVDRRDRLEALHTSLRQLHGDATPIALDPRALDQPLVLQLV